MTPRLLLAALIVANVLSAIGVVFARHEHRQLFIALTDELGLALVVSPPLDAAKGGYVAEGYDATLDALRLAASDGRRAIAQLEARYRDSTAVSSLKIRHNAVLGYHVEVALCP